MEDRIKRVRQLLGEIRHVALATVNSDGTPHNTPVFAALDDKLCAYWASRIDSEHSLNIAASGNVFLVLFDSREGHGGLYIEGKAHIAQDGSEFSYALEIFRKAKHTRGRTIPGASHFQNPSSQRLYKLTPNRLWINISVHDKDGLVVRDIRREVSVKELTDNLYAQA